jgi:hypothetical protein
MNTVTLQSQPSLTQLNSLIKRVQSYPISVSGLLDLARASKQPKEVLDFYKSFRQDQVFEDPDDLQSRSEQVEMMRQEEKDMPRELETAPEEY